LRRVYCKKTPTEHVLFGTQEEKLQYAAEFAVARVFWAKESKRFINISSAYICNDKKREVVGWL
jgi:hypothetical protein